MEGIGFATNSSVSQSHPSGDLAWDLDVDAFLDDYLKEVGPEGQDPFGNFAIDVNTLGAAFPAAAAAAPACTQPECTQQQQQQATTLTSEFGATTLVSSEVATAAARPSKQVGQRRASQPKAQNNSKESQDAKSIRKQLALQEKNRRAQRRFRERQKQKVEELTAQVEQLTAQLNAVLSEKSGLESRTGVLENVLAMREKQLESMGANPAEAPDVKPSPVATAMTAGSDVSATTEQEDAELAVVFQEDLTLSVREGQPQTLSAAQVKGMTPVELSKYYKAYVNELAGCLVEQDGQPASPERIRRLVDEVCLLCTRVALCNPPGVKHFTLTRVTEDAPGAAAQQHADDRVPQMVRALAIAPQQRSQLSQLRRLFLQKLAKIVNDRKEVNSQLLSAVPAGTSHRQMALRYLASHDAVRKLRDNMREEHILVLDFVSTIFKHVLSAQQVAQFMIHSFPYTPDCLALSTWVAAEDGDAEALSMLAAEAQGKQQAAAVAAAAQQQQQQQAVAGGQGQGVAAGRGCAAAAPGAPAAAAAATAGLPAGVPPPAMFALPADQSAMFAAGALPPMFAPGQMPLLPNGQALIGNMAAVSSAQLMQFGSAPAIMQLPASFNAGCRPMPAQRSAAAACPAGQPPSLDVDVDMKNSPLGSPTSALGMAYYCPGAATMANNFNGLLKMGAGAVGLPSLAMAKPGCFPQEMAAGMLPVSPHVVTMTSSSR